MWLWAICKKYSLRGFFPIYTCERILGGGGGGGIDLVDSGVRCGDELRLWLGEVARLTSGDIVAVGNGGTCNIYTTFTTLKKDSFSIINNG